MLVRRSLLLAALGLAVPSAGAVAVPQAGTVQGPDEVAPARPEPWRSTYRALPSSPTVIRNATVMTAAGVTFENGAIYMADGRIQAVGPSVDAPSDALVVDGSGKYMTPGLIDPHSHMGVYPNPSTRAHSDGNEATDPTTPEVWAQHSVWPHDPGITRALSGGVTTAQILPGSANLIGGRGVTVKLVPGRTAEEMMFPGAKYGLKMACGENPKRVYADDVHGPSTRMGELALDRQKWQEAVEYRRDWREYERKREAGEEADRPEVDMGLETLKAVLDGEIFVNIHCYQSDDMARMIGLAEEFGFEIRAFHHSLSTYKIRDILAEKGIGAVTWADWWGFKMEAYDGIVENLGLLTEAGARAILHSDSDLDIQRLNQEMAKAYYAARRAGIAISRDDALRWATANVAWLLELDDVIGTLEAGKHADVVLWDGDPFSIYTRAERVWIDGALVYDLTDPARQPTTDFEAGVLPPEVVR